MVHSVTVTVGVCALLASIKVVLVKSQENFVDELTQSMVVDDVQVDVQDFTGQPSSVDKQSDVLLIVH